MTRFLLILSSAVLALATLLPDQTRAHGYKKRSLEIVHPWTFEQENVVLPTAVVGMELRNSGKTSDRLIGVETTEAKRAVIVVQSASETAPHRPAIEIKPGETVRLSAAGPHVRLDGVKPKLFAYNILQITLVFERAGRIKVEVQVEERPD